MVEYAAIRRFTILIDRQAIIEPRTKGKIAEGKTDGLVS